MRDSRTGEDGLTEREYGLVAEIANKEGNTPDFSAAGFSDEEGARLAVRREPVQTAIRVGLEAKLKTTGATKAIKTILDLMDDKHPAATRLSAAKWVAEAAGIGPATAEATGDRKPIDQMTNEELERFVKRMASVQDATLKPVIDHVAPDDGALNPTPGQGGAQKP